MRSGNVFFVCVCLFLQIDQHAFYHVLVHTLGKPGIYFVFFSPSLNMLLISPVPVDFLTLVLLYLSLFFFDLHAFIGYLLINFYRILKANAIRSLL